MDEATENIQISKETESMVDNLIEKFIILTKKDTE